MVLGLIKLAAKQQQQKLQMGAQEASLSQHHDSNCLKFLEEYILICHILKIRKWHKNVRKMACWGFSNCTQGTANILMNFQVHI
jgi:hypothetical protein